ncbi:MAG: sensor histidine kinase, partial [Anaerolineae bacterium]
WDKDPEDARRQLEEVARLTRGALEEMRALLLELRPATIAQVPLEELLKRLANSTVSNARLTVHLDADAGQPLPSQVRVALYRIAQEALNNVVKHASASQVWITLRPISGEPGGARGEEPDPGSGDRTIRGAELSIRDDGQGFDLGAVEGDHLGLAIMRERAEDIHARLTLITGPGQGTTVSVIWKPRVAAGLPEGDAAVDSYGAYAAYQRERASWRISVEEGEGALDDDEGLDPERSVYG